MSLQREKRFRHYLGLHLGSHGDSREMERKVSAASIKRSAELFRRKGYAQQLTKLHIWGEKNARRKADVMREPSCGSGCALLIFLSSPFWPHVRFFLFFLVLTLLLLSSREFASSETTRNHHSHEPSQGRLPSSIILPASSLISSFSTSPSFHRLFHSVCVSDAFCDGSGFCSFKQVQ